VSGTGFRGKTHCQRGHDLTLPNAIGFDSNSSKRFCRLCRNMRKLASLKRAAERQRKCQGCGTVVTHGKKWRFCSTACEAKIRRRNEEELASKASHVDAVLSLYDQLHRAATWWERDDIKKQIADLQANP